MSFKFIITIPKIGMLLLVYLCGLLNGSYKLKAQNIPDANFATAIRAACPTCIDASNNLLPPAASLTSLNVSNKNIANLTGIGGFTSLQTLYCYSNQLTSLPTLPNTLEVWGFDGNQLTSLPTLPSNITHLFCTNNQLTSLPPLPAGLTNLGCATNQLTSLPTLPNGLKSLACSENPLNSLPSLPNTLESLTCSNNQLTALPTLPSSLTFLQCYNNQLTSLPTLPENITFISCPNNQITTLPLLPSSLQDLRIDADKITCLPNLVEGLQVYSGYSTPIPTPPVCPPFTPIHIPDDNFAAAIRTICPTCIDASDNLLPPTTNLTNLDVSNKNIADLTGVSGFTGLSYLDCNSNLLTTLPSLPINLIYLYCDRNQLTSLPSLPTSLSSLVCERNQLTALPNLPLPLALLACSGNQIRMLPTLPSFLRELHIDPDKITCLPNSVTGLKVYNSSRSLIATPPVCPISIHIPDDNFAAAIRAACPTCIDNSDNLLPPAANLTFLTLFNKNVSDLTGIHGFTGLKIFSCNYNKLTTLPTLPDSLESFACSNNQLTSLPTLPGGLKFLRCHGNLIYCLPSLPNSLSYLSIDANKIKCLPNTVIGLTISDESGNTDALTFPICTEVCSNTPCNPPPTPSLSANPATIKKGESSVLTATNCAGTLTWSTGQTGSSITVSPTNSRVYSAFCTVDGCSSGYARISVSIACEVPTPSLLATPGTISVGDSSIITATGCETGILTWTLNGSSIGTGNSIKVKPTQTTGYNVNCVIGSCSSSAYIQITIPCSIASPSISASPALISVGASSTLTATGCAGTVTWWNSNTGGQPIGTGNSITVSPTQTTNYNANCTVNNCISSSSNVQVTIPCSLPTPSVSASPGIINAGQSSTLTATGCTGLVTWFKVGQGSSIGTSTTIVVNPTSTSEYYALCNVNGCSSNDAHVFVTISCEVPATPSLTASPGTINSGQSTTLTATNCTGSVSWYNAFGGVFLGAGNSITVSPTSNNSYFATCTVNGCQSGNSFVEVIVTTSGLRVSACTPPASPSVSANTYTANPGQSVTLTATNCAGTINWRNSTANTSLGTGASIVVTPTETTDYYVYCTFNGCSSSTSWIKIVVLCTTPTPGVSATPSIINAGGTVTLNAANCNGIVNWFRSGTALGITGNSLTVTPTQSATYAANCTANGCTSSKAFAAVQIACTVPPTPNLLATPGSIQSGQSATLTATGCAGTVTWYSSSGGSSIGTGNSVSVSPTQSTNYYAFCAVNNCSGNSSNVYVSVPCTPPPTPSVVASPSALNAGQNTTLTATNCAGTVTWYKSGTNNAIGTGNSITAVVTQSSYYYAYCTVNGCQSNNSRVNVNILCAVPPTPSVSANPNSISSGQSATLTATGCTGTVTWYNAAGGASLGIGNSFVVSPISLTTYTAYCNANSCSSDGANVEVVVATNPCPPTKTLTGTVSTLSPMTETASVSIESTQIIQPNTNVTYRSPVILFKPGTEIQKGAIFKTEQGGCN